MRVLRINFADALQPVTQRFPGEYSIGFRRQFAAQPRRPVIADQDQSPPARLGREIHLEQVPRGIALQDHTVKLLAFLRLELSKIVDERHIDPALVFRVVVGDSIATF